MRSSRRLDIASIVLRGSFNPAIFQPEWFERSQLLSRDEVDAAAPRTNSAEPGPRSFVITQDVALWTTGWLQLQVTHDQFSATTERGDNIDRLGELVAGTFRLLEHTPVTKLGMNRTLHMQLATDDDYARFGEWLCPPDRWKPLMNNPKVYAVQIGGQCLARRQARLHVLVNPSARVERGVSIQTNEEHDVTRDSSAADILHTYWGTAMEEGVATIESLVTSFEGAML